jgi:Phosphotransferase enzyme family
MTASSSGRARGWPAAIDVRAAVAGDLGQRGVRRLVNGRSTRREIHAAIHALAPSLPAAQSLRLRRVTWKPARNARASFDLVVSDGTVPVHLRWFVDRVEPGLAPSRSPHVPIRATVGDIGPAHRGASLFTSRSADTAGGQLLVWPTDPECPHVATLLSSRLTELAALVGETTPPAVRAVRYRPGQRHVIEVRGANTAVFVKVGAPHATAGVLAGAEALRLALAAQPVKVVDAVWVNDELGAIGYQALPGRPLSAIVRAANPGAVDALRTTGELFAVLHARGTPTARLPMIDPHVEAAAVLRACEHALALEPALRDPLGALVADAVNVLGDDGDTASAVLHGDAKFDHVLVSRGSLGLIDIDAVAIGDPAFDIARLLADLVWLAPRRQLSVFRTALLTGVGNRQAHFARRVAAWEALARVKQAARRVPVLDERLTERIGATVADAAALLRDSTS